MYLLFTHGQMILDELEKWEFTMRALGMNIFVTFAMILTSIV